jgi:hypothetical protein
MRLDHIKAGGEELGDELFVPIPEPPYEELY